MTDNPGRYSADQSDWPAHLRDDAPSQRCSACGRSTWATSQFGAVCGMTQPDGQRCAGIFGPAATPEPVVPPPTVHLVPPRTTIAEHITLRDPARPAAVSTGTADGEDSAMMRAIAENARALALRSQQRGSRVQLNPLDVIALANAVLVDTAPASVLPATPELAAGGDRLLSALAESLSDPAQASATNPAVIADFARRTVAALAARDTEVAQIKERLETAWADGDAKALQVVTLTQQVAQQRDMLQRLRANSDRVCAWFWANDPAVLKDDGPTDAVLKKLDAQAAEVAQLRAQLTRALNEIGENT